MCLYCMLHTECLIHGLNGICDIRKRFFTSVRFYLTCKWTLDSWPLCFSSYFVHIITRKTAMADLGPGSLQCSHCQSSTTLFTVQSSRRDTHNRTEQSISRYSNLYLLQQRSVLHWKARVNTPACSYGTLSCWKRYGQALGTQRPYSKYLSILPLPEDEVRGEQGCSWCSAEFPRWCHFYATCLLQAVAAGYGGIAKKWDLSIDKITVWALSHQCLSCASSKSIYCPVLSQSFTCCAAFVQTLIHQIQKKHEFNRLRWRYGWKAFTERRKSTVSHDDLFF